MGIRKRSIQSGLYLFLVFIASGCKPELKAGSYSGNLFRREGQEISSLAVDTTVQLDQGYYGTLIVRDAKTQVLETLEAKWNHKTNRIKMKMGRLGVAIELRPKTSFNFSSSMSRSMHCYTGETDFQVTLCFAKNQFSLNVMRKSTPEITLSLDGIYNSQQIPIAKEEPRKFTRSQAIQNVFSKSFDEKIEYQIVEELKQRSKAAWMNLLPHLNFKDLFAISSLVPRTIATFVADFVPFLLPTRWFQKNEAVALSDAERLTLDILRSDLAYQIEALGYTYHRDLSNTQFYAQEKKRVSDLYEKILLIAHEDIGKLGSLADEFNFRLTVIENFIRQDKNRLENAIELEKTSLAYQMGYFNPKVVQDFDIEESSLEIQSAKPLQEDVIIELALKRSLELKQLDQLMVNAENQKREWYFNWMDPDAAAASAVSLSIIPNIKRADAVIGEMIARRNKVAAQVKLNAANAVINYNKALELYQITEDSLDELQSREILIYDDIEKALSSSQIHTNGAATQYALNTYFQFKLRQNDSIAAFQIARAQIRRVLFEYYYQGVQPRAFSALEADLTRKKP